MEARPIRLLPALAVIVTALCLGVGSASASSSVEVVDENTGLNCSVLPITICGEDISGSFSVHYHSGTSEVVISACTSTFEALIEGNGEGAIHNQTLSGMSCALAACDEPAPSHETLEWPFAIAEVLPAHEVMGVDLCLRGAASAEGSAEMQCRVVLDMVNVPIVSYEFEANGAPCLEGPSFEIHGNWVMDSDGVEVEIFHQ